MTESDKEWIELPSGMQYRELTAGDGGVKPNAKSVVSVHYEGRLEDGDLFDSSYERGEPEQFPLRAVIKGWTEGVQLMTKGAVFQFLIPHNLAYGEEGYGDAIPPFETLKFEIELLDFA